VTCLRVQISQQAGDRNVPDKIADDFDRFASASENSTPKNSSSNQQLELIEGIKVKIVPEMRFICQLLDINTYSVQSSGKSLLPCANATLMHPFANAFTYLNGQQIKGLWFVTPSESTQRTLGNFERYERICCFSPVSVP
jgi:hypothetical protein